MLENTFLNLLWQNLNFIKFEEEQTLFFVLYLRFSCKPKFKKVPCFVMNFGLTSFRLEIGVIIVNLMISIKNIHQTSLGSGLINCWRAQFWWSLISRKTYNILWNIWCVIFQNSLFVRSWLQESMGDHRYPNWILFYPFEWYFQIDPRWHARFILQGPIGLSSIEFNLTTGVNRLTIRSTPGINCHS